MTADKILKYAAVTGFAVFAFISSCQLISVFAATVVSDGRYTNGSTATQLKLNGKENSGVAASLVASHDSTVSPHVQAGFAKLRRQATLLNVTVNQIDATKINVSNNTASLGTLQGTASVTPIRLDLNHPNNIGINYQLAGTNKWLTATYNSGTADTRFTFWNYRLNTDQFYFSDNSLDSFFNGAVYTPSIIGGTSTGSTVRIKGTSAATGGFVEFGKVGSKTTYYQNDDTLAYRHLSSSTGNNAADPAQRAAFPLLASHASMSSPHTPPQIFGNPTGARFPVFTGGDNWQWQRPLEVCGADPATAVFDGKNATFRCSTTTTLPAGSAAAVRNDGTLSDGILKFSIPQGATGVGRDALYCNISAAVRAVSYDSFGVNPQPSLLPMALQMWHGALRIVADTITWWTGGPAQRVFGSATTALFTPSTKPTFSHISSNNYVAVTARYSSALTGVQYCTAGIPIAVTRVGIKGDAGADGSPDDQAGILAKIDDPTTGAILSMQQGNGEATTAAKIRVQQYSPALTLWYVDAGGNAYHKDANGYDRVKLGNDGSINIKDANNKLRLTINTSGEIVAYRGDGTTIAFARYSTRLVL